MRDIDLTIDQLRALWKELESVEIEMIDDYPCIAKDFNHFEKGTSTIYIWHWIDDRCPNGIYMDIINYKK